MSGTTRSKTVGLLGFGNVARMVAHRLASFEVEIIYSDIRPADMVTERSLRAKPVTCCRFTCR
jgi:D-3-phosphoglycerate dehydrogenase / 2-oxoglutarate reductase